MARFDRTRDPRQNCGSLSSVERPAGWQAGPGSGRMRRSLPWLDAVAFAPPLHTSRTTKTVLLTITTTHRPATDLGFLLHKNPARAQEFELAFGKAHVFYPEASEDRCTAALLLDVDPVALVRGRGALTTDYVNDRPYAASSFMSVAIARVFGSAMGGRCRERPELVDKPLPLVAEVAALPCRGGGEARDLFEPLDYEVGIAPDGDPDTYRNLTLSGSRPLAELLTHLYVLIPVLDGRKHYWVGDAEVDKLVARGEGWLESHPHRNFIVRRYLKGQRSLASDALARLADDAVAESVGDDDGHPDTTTSVALADARLAAVTRVLKEGGASRVIDLGCGEGRLVEQLLADIQFQEIVGVDVSARALEVAARRLKLSRMPERQRRRVKLLQGAMTYRDRRLEGFDAVAVVEALEHLDADRLGAFERALFAFAKPETVIVTTPNREYNVKYPAIAPDGLRHADHRFEWTRAEFAAWANAVAGAHGYSVEFEPVGDVDSALGAPTQMGRFRRCA